jgi:hypothetical protein
MWLYECTAAGHHDALLDALWWTEQALINAGQDGEDAAQLYQDVGVLEWIRLGRRCDRSAVQEVRE